MFVSALILMVPTVLLFFYLPVVCDMLLRRRSTQEFYKAIVNANRLEFPSVRTAIEDFGSPGGYSHLTTALRCDFMALTYLLKNATNVNQQCTYEEHLLILYFQVLNVSLVVRHGLGLRKTSALLKLTAILQYFANVVGERVNAVRYGELTASDYLLHIESRCQAPLPSSPSWN
jgi:hypothetical protein